MYMRVHFFTVCCFPAAGVGPLAAARDPAVERDRTCLVHGACPQLLLPTATMAPVQSPSSAHPATRSSSGPLSSLRGGDGAVAGTSVLLVHCDGAGEAARPSSAISSTCHPAPPSRRTEKALSFLRNVFVFSLWAAELCPSPPSTGPSSSQVLCNSRALS